ncbi:hypothetical protein FHX44_112062 [Pseudonocardia hierapolitana]|uniref:Uncharacterized protein n=1 Tax=Pseudonocardia hierapolitana TaxID=1128676 RepID=A0A561SMT7_9PSEU|nr:hypothetical protein [Pseudonocardia hierapolitana]TWF76174.1 hypothetical protein FHX44_112062 [Pseudonocardia hierapolitana]
MNLFRRCAAVLAVATVMAGGTAFEASATTSAKSDTFGPAVITDVPKAPDTTKGEKPIQKVVALATIDTTLQAGRTAYVYSTVTASEADDVNLIDNEVRCSGAGKANVVMGENVMPRTSGSPLSTITVVTRFLVKATTSGELTCNQYLRTASTSPNVSRETVKSELRFASEDVIGDVNGAALQRSLPPGNTPVTSSVTTPVLSGRIPAGLKELAVIADVEFHRCNTASKCTVKARFALSVSTSGGANCPSAPVAQIERTLQRGVNHAAVPLYTIVPLKAGCTDFQAKVTTTHLAGDPGSVGGEVKLPDKTGPITSDPKHDSAMTHVFAVPS